MKCSCTECVIEKLLKKMTMESYWKLPMLFMNLLYKRIQIHFGKHGKISLEVVKGKYALRV